MIWWFLACVVNEGGPSSAGSSAAAAVQKIEIIQAHAQTIETLSIELESMTDDARQAMPGRPRREQIARMRQLMVQIEEENEALQTALQNLESDLHIAADDPTWPRESASP